MELVIPSSRFKESFLEALFEYQKNEPHDQMGMSSLNISALRNNFYVYLNRIFEVSLGKNLPEGYVPQTEYWLVDNNKFIGRVDIRHSLTEKLLYEGGHIGYSIRPSKRRQGYGKKNLELALPKTKEFGITKALGTCDETNISSKKIIEANGGVFENSVKMGEEKSPKLRYWITL